MTSLHFSNNTFVPGDLPFDDWMRGVLSSFEAALQHYLPSSDVVPQRLHEAMRYTVLGGGKRVRPLLVAAAGELVGGEQTAILAAGCAIELIHCYSLVHDDMPCMDDDALRRGRPTVHVQYDEATALLVGDALQTRAFEILADDTLPHGLRSVATLAKASGSRGMAGGQAIDLGSVGIKIDRTTLEIMHRMKTGALLKAAVELGLLSAQQIAVEQYLQLAEFGQIIGLAFQVVDDILDATASTEALGKTAGKDEANDKPTYVSMLGLQAAQTLAKSLHENALTLLAPYGENAGRLRQLADLIIARSH